MVTVTDRGAIAVEAAKQDDAILLIVRYTGIGLRASSRIPALGEAVVPQEALGIAPPGA